MGAQAQAPAADEQRFQDWLLRCETDPADATVKQCFIAQGVAAGEERRRVMMVAVAYPPDRKAPIFTAVLPLGVDLRSGIELAIDGGEPKRLPFTICLAGCWPPSNGVWRAASPSAGRLKSAGSRCRSRSRASPRRWAP
jgi:invasion protein IalB